MGAGARARTRVHDGRARVQRPRPRATCSSPSSRRGATATTRSPSTTRPTCRPPTTTSPSTAGSTRAGAPTPSSTSASTARSSGCRARASASPPACWPDAALGDVPLFYPFVVNDPGEGTQAKRRAHAVVIDHLLPPMTRADTYDDLARLEQLSTSTPRSRRSTRPSCPRCAAGSGTCSSTPRSTATSAWPTTPDDDDVRRRDRPRRRLPVRAQGRPDPRRPPHARARARGRRRSIDLVLAITRLAHGRVPVAARARWPRELGRRPRRRRADARRRRGALPRSWSRPPPRDGWTRRRRRPPTAAVGLRLAGARRCAARPTRSTTCCRPRRALRAGRARAARPPAAARTCCRPGRNFYSVDPKALPIAAGVGRRARRWPTPCSSATWPRTGELPRHRRAWCCGARPPCAPRATTWPRRSRCSASGRSGTPSRGRVVGLEPIPLAELGRPAHRRRRCASPASSATPSRTWCTCSTTPSRWSAALDEPPEHEPRARPRRATTPASSAPRRARYGVGHPAAARERRLALRRRPRRRLPRLARLRLRPRRLRRAAPRTPCAAASPPSTWR